MKLKILLAVSLIIIATLTTYIYHSVDSPGIHYTRGVKSFELREYTDAIQYLSQAVRLRPNYRKAIEILALAAIKDSELEIAKKQLIKLSKFSSHDRFARRGLAQLEAMSGNTKEAIAQLDILLDEEPYDFPSIKALADIYFNAGKYREAIPLYSFFNNEFPQNIDSSKSLAMSLFHFKKYKDGFGILKKIISIYPKDISILTLYARINFDIGNVLEALTAYKKVLSIKPNGLVALRSIANIYAHINNWENALLYIQKAKETFPDDQLTAVTTANFLLWSKQLNKAEKEFKRLYKKTPNDTRVLQGLAYSYSWQNKVRKALPYLERLVKINPNNINYSRDLSQAYLSLKMFKKSSNLFDTSKLLTDSPTPDMHMANARAKMGIGNIKQVMRSINAVLENDANNIMAQTLLADVYMRTNKFEKAVVTLKRLTVINPNDYFALEKIGDLLQKLQHYDKANEYYNKALKLKKKNKRSSK